MLTEFSSISKNVQEEVFYIGNMVIIEQKFILMLDWVGFLSNHKSTSGYYSFGTGNLVTWHSKRQVVLARSSAKAEFRSMAHGKC